MAVQRHADTGWSTLGALRRINRRLTGAMSRLAEQLLYRSSRIRHFVAVSNGVATEIRRHFPGLSYAITVIPNAVDLEAYRPDRVERGLVRRTHGLSDSDLVVLFVGGDWERKGLMVAIQAVAKFRGCHLLVVGSGDIDRFRTEAQRLHCDERIHFAGWRQDPGPYYAAADIFLLPSAYETFSLVTYEAAAAGLPLLVTRVSGVDEILADGENGWFVERDPDIIRARIETLAADQELREVMGARSRAAVANVSWSRMVRDYVSLYGQGATGRQVAHRE
jgi:UDP-glucose:(heptosyl)LPS alpha-1,3-glucosyltransferase